MKQGSIGKVLSTVSGTVQAAADTESPGQEVRSWEERYEKQSREGQARGIMGLINKGFPTVPVCTGCLLIGASETAREGTPLGVRGTINGGHSS